MVWIRALFSLLLKKVKRLRSTNDRNFTSLFFMSGNVCSSVTGISCLSLMSGDDKVSVKRVSVKRTEERQYGSFVSFSCLLIFLFDILATGIKIRKVFLGSLSLCKKIKGTRDKIRVKRDISS